LGLAAIGGAVYHYGEHKVTVRITSVEPSMEDGFIVWATPELDRVTSTNVNSGESVYPFYLDLSATPSPNVGDICNAPSFGFDISIRQRDKPPIRIMSKAYKLDVDSCRPSGQGQGV